MSKLPLPLRPPFATVLLLGAVIAATALTFGPPSRGGASSSVTDSNVGEPADSSEKAPAAVAVTFDESLLGNSGRLRALISHTDEPIAEIAVSGSCDALRWKRIGGSELRAVDCVDGAPLAPMSAGAWRLEEHFTPEPSERGLLSSVLLERADSDQDSFRQVDGLPTVLALRPRSDKRDGRIEGYRIGEYPTRPPRYGPAYEPPGGFIEVDEATSNLRVSESFRLGEFLTKDQHDLWPKYLVLDMRLIDKLELVVKEIRSMGHEATGLFIMSGYRTPSYNGDGSGGRSRFSRHIYGDAADVWLDESGDGKMDDLTGNGRSGLADARVLAKAARRVQDRHPDLLGGIGVYGPRGARGPFVHIDVRGTPARW